MQMDLQKKKNLSGITKFDICSIPACLQSRDSDDERNPDGGQEETSSCEMMQRWRKARMALA